MSIIYKWQEAPVRRPDVDPYSKWLLDTAKQCQELRRFSGRQPSGNYWSFGLVRRPAVENPEGNPEDGLARIDEKTLAWSPSGSDASFVLLRRPLNDVEAFMARDRSLADLVFGDASPADPERLGADTALRDVVEDEQKAVHELYTQLAPFDDDMVPAGKLVKPAEYKPVAKNIDPEHAVIYGVIDDGINIAHERFLDSEGNPRVDYAWLQDGIARPDSSVMFGRELLAAEIRDALDLDTEEQTLRALGLVDPAKAEATTLSKAFSHGTFVLDALAGYDRELDDKDLKKEAGERQQDGNQRKPDKKDAHKPENHRIVSVQLHRRVTLETSGALYALFAVSGLQYIVDRARRIAKSIKPDGGKKVPLVVNFSYGLAGGPHNGQHLFERYVDRLVDQLDNDPHLGPLIVTIPVGNRHLLNGHAHVQADASGNAALDLNWVTQPQDPSPNYLELWAPLPDNTTAFASDADPKPVSLTLSPPFGAGKFDNLSLSFDIANPGLDQDRELRNTDGKVLARVTVDALDAANAGLAAGSRAKVRLLIALTPTRPTYDDEPCLPPGVWRVRLEANDIGQEKYLEAWVQRDDSPPFFRRPGRQSYLENKSWSIERQSEEELEEFVNDIGPDAGLSRYGAISGLATGNRMVCVSGVRHHDDDLPSLYSGAAHGNARNADLSAPADRSRVFRGLVGSGGRSGSSQVMNGTSVAAPIIGRGFGMFLSVQKKTLKADIAIKRFKKKLQHLKSGGTAPLSRKSRRRGEVVLEKHPELKERRFGRIVTKVEGNEIMKTKRSEQRRARRQLRR